MIGRPKRLTELWTEEELCVKLGLPITKSGRSVQLGNWIKDGLKCVEKSGKRYFFEQDVLAYLTEVSEKGLQGGREGAET